MILGIIIGLVIGGFLGYVTGSNAGYTTGYDTARSVYKPVVAAKPTPVKPTPSKVAVAARRGRPTGSKTKKGKGKKAARKN